MIGCYGCFSWMEIMRVRLTQIDGKLPNLALMKLASWHKSRGDDVVFTRRVNRDLLEDDYDLVYGSCIFGFSAPSLNRFREEWPEAIVGGTGSGSTASVEDITGDWDSVDYSMYPDYTASLGFTQRGCRMSCKFCVVPGKEGKNRSVSSINEIWRGGENKKNIHLLDNDFFGQPQNQWNDRVIEIMDGGFNVCLNQGINIRLLDDISASTIGQMFTAKKKKDGSIIKQWRIRDDSFKDARLYTAWDNLKDENIFFSGLDRLEKYGFPAEKVMVYMLVGYDKNETWERIWHRFNRMVNRKVMPYPMVFDCRASDRERYIELKRFQRWVVTGMYNFLPWEEYTSSFRRNEVNSSQIELGL